MDYNYNLMYNKRSIHMDMFSFINKNVFSLAVFFKIKFFISFQQGYITVFILMILSLYNNKHKRVTNIVYFSKFYSIQKLLQCRPQLLNGQCSQICKTPSKNIVLRKLNFEYNCVKIHVWISLFYLYFVLNSYRTIDRKLERDTMNVMVH